MYLLQCWELNVVFVCLFVFCLPGKYLPLSYNPRPLFTFIIDIFFMCVYMCVYLFMLASVMSVCLCVYVSVYVCTMCVYLHLCVCVHAYVCLCVLLLACI